MDNITRHVLAHLYVYLSATSLFSQTEQLYTPNQVAAAPVTCGANNVPAYGFAFNSTTFTNPVFTGLNNFVTSGTYVAADITNFKLYQTNFSVFNTSNLLATITTGLGPGAHSFPAFSYTVATSPVARYFWITVDVKPTAVNGHTIIVNALTTAMTTITGTETAATITAGGTQTINCTPLTVELLDFRGSTQGGRNILEWETGTETNNDYFILEKSSDGMVFSKLGEIDGAGNSNTRNSYSFMDESQEEVNYYRLRQRDFDGAEACYKTILIYKDKGMFVAFPNPASDLLVLEADAGEFKLFNAAGLFVRSAPIEKGANIIMLSDLGEGMYFLEVNGVLKQKLLVER